MVTMTRNKMTRSTMFDPVKMKDMLVKLENTLLPKIAIGKHRTA